MLGEAVAETIWATRCVVCDRPGTLLCDTCRTYLPYIDRWLACPRCGSPHGQVQCMDCNSFSLAEVGRADVPFERCVSAIEHRGATRALVTAYKDAGERRLSGEIARIVADTLPGSWVEPGCALAFVPADRKARRRRGFDHMELVARELADVLGVPCMHALEKLPAADQRGLGRRERFRNMVGTIRARPALAGLMPESAILVDDVYTTGATLFAASDALRLAGVKRLRCATFARVP